MKAPDTSDNGQRQVLPRDGYGRPITSQQAPVAAIAPAPTPVPVAKQLPTPAGASATAVAEARPKPPHPLPTVPCVDPSTLRPPTFGRVPRAAAAPWHLTVEPTASGIAADQAKLGDLHVRAASIVGPSHRCEEPAVARQDSYRLGRDDAGRHLIVAVADGMSDSRRSDLGATVAVRYAVNAVRDELNRGQQPDEAMMRNAFHRSAGAMATAARDTHLSSDAVRCALILAILPAQPDGDHGQRIAWFGSLADVSAWLRAGPTWQQLAGDRKDSGMDRNVVRHFLPHHPSHIRTVAHVLPPGATVTVVTDGVGDAFTDIPEADRWFAKRWQSPMPLESFLLDVGYHASGQLDDRTAVTVWCGHDERR